MDPVTFAPIAVLATLSIVTIRYAILCHVLPFTRCRRCGGTGRTPRRIGRGSRPCRRCDGTGLRLRWGRHLLNYARRLHRDGTR
uniref:hypothetical protein n=1 Tax=Nonomuraea pusilla TaxID=46177 RepID=UPI0006E3B09F|nr:hypothetical protein [Nonomuraea pusilla]